MVERVLAVPNWSFARELSLARECRGLLDATGLTVHYCQGDADHNRTVTAFSGPATGVGDAVRALARLVLPRIDLRRHVGVHPRIGGLDVCPFVPLGHPGPGDLAAFSAWVDRSAAEFASEFEVPVFLYERSEKGRHEAELPALRRGGFGGLASRSLDPDYGPVRSHERLGATVWGWRDFLIALNVNLAEADAAAAKGIAKQVRAMRADGDPRMLGVRALGLPLPSRGLSQVSMNLTLPNVTPVDPVVQFVLDRASALGIAAAGRELVGVVRPRDVAQAGLVPIQPCQVVEGAE